MYKSVTVGEMQLTEPVVDPKELVRLMELIITQNQMIVESNCQAMRMISGSSEALERYRRHKADMAGLEVQRLKRQMSEEADEWADSGDEGQGGSP